MSSERRLIGPREPKLPDPDLELLLLEEEVIEAKQAVVTATNAVHQAEHKVEVFQEFRKLFPNYWR